VNCSVVNCNVGIDLGSTTTKAVVLDDNGVVVGRGITNSRSNYDVACQIALTQALVDTRFWLVSSELERAGVSGPLKKNLLAELERGFRHQQYLGQLRSLRRVLLDLVKKVSANGDVGSSVGRIVAGMDQKSEGLFAAGARRMSDFFRDLAGSHYLELAEGEAASGGPSFDTLVGLYDRAILEVENTPELPDCFRTYGFAALQDMDSSVAELRQALESAARVELNQAASVGTGYGRARLPFPKDKIRSEILCHGLGAHCMFPGTRTVLDIGGQDTKAIQVDQHGIVTSFQMNDRCAAGCGRYLGYIADEMNLGLHELGPLAAKATRPVRINSTCTVFAGAELRQRLSVGQKREDILAGLHRAIILRAMSLLARSGGVFKEFTLTGGVAKNETAVAVLRKLTIANYGSMEVNISPDSIYTGALGAALFALRSRREEPETPAVSSGRAKRGVG
jgi:benzoyl-CoA reductase subunit A